MLADVLTSVISGVVSGLIGGAAAGFAVVRYTTKVVGSGAAATGQSQVAQAREGSQAAASHDGPINQAQASVSALRAADVVLSLEQRVQGNRRTEALVVKNPGDSAVEDLSLGPPPDGGGFVAQPDWPTVPKRLAPRETIELPCSSNGTGQVVVISQFSTVDRRIGPHVVTVRSKL